MYAQGQGDGNGKIQPDIGATYGDLGEYLAIPRGTHLKITVRISAHANFDLLYASVKEKFAEACRFILIPFLLAAYRYQSLFFRSRAKFSAPS